MLVHRVSLHISEARIADEPKLQQGEMVIVLRAHGETEAITRIRQAAGFTLPDGEHVDLVRYRPVSLIKSLDPRFQNATETPQVVAYKLEPAPTS